MNARTATIAGSLALHVLVAGAAFYYAGKPKPKRRDSIAVMGEKKPAPKEDKPPPPPPKPKPAMRSVEPAPAPLAPAPPPEAKAPPRSTAPAVTGTLSNEPSGGSGGEIGSAGAGAGEGNASAGAGGSGEGGHKAAAAAKPAGEEAPCTEQPTKPQAVSRPTEIEYTSQARADGIEGRLVLKIVVDADGSVREVIVVSSVDPALDAAAIAAVKTWVWRPAMRCGKPMGGGTFVLAQRFELGD